VKTFGLDIRFTRTFHYSGPGQPSGFVISDFARQIALLEARRIRKVTVGNARAYRDFVDVRDAVRAYRLLLQKGKPGDVYNVCSGNMVQIESILRMVLGLSSVKQPEVTRNHRGKLRSLDVPRLVGSNDRLKAATGWRPRIALNKTVADVLDYWRCHIRTAKELI
jgi:GDP-4-dehydro-6-deoxy-D-mannose reductase